MQTFLPYSDFQASAAALDYRRLGKQRVESKYILKTLFNKSTGAWSRHPAVRMWEGHLKSLAVYSLAMCDEWVRRGYKDTLASFFYVFRVAMPDTGPPDWLGDSEFHRSHRSNLVRKRPDIYQPLFPDVDGSLPYVWPV